MTNTIITPTEVVALGGLNKDFPTCDVRDIWHVEQGVRYKCLGPDFYDALISDKKDFSGVNYAGNRARHCQT